jgi:hypothetical protein
MAKPYQLSLNAAVQRRKYLVNGCHARIEHYVGDIVEKYVVPGRREGAGYGSLIVRKDTVVN